MTVTPQTNTTLAGIAEVLSKHESFVICGHVSPDGDCLGSQLALAAALESCGKRAVCVLAKDDPIEENLAALSGADGLVYAGDYEGSVEVFVGVDVPTLERVGDAARLHDAAQVTVTIDHHAVDSTMADHVYVDPDAASTTLLIWEVARLMGARREGPVAECCYTGLLTDTGRFQYQNTDRWALSAAAEMVAAGADPARIASRVSQNRSVASVRLDGLAVERMKLVAGGAAAISHFTVADFERLGAVKADAEPAVNVLRCIRGVRVACMLREQPDGIRGSLRAKDDSDVSAIARGFDGGGHKAAAGFTLHCTLDEALLRVEEAVERAVVCG